MGGHYTLRNRHRKKDFLRGGAPRIDNLRNRVLGEQTSASERAKLTETINRNDAQRRILIQAAKKMTQAELNRKKALLGNTRIPVHPNEYRADSLATITRDKIKTMAEESLARIKEETAKIRIKAQNEIDAAQKRIDELTPEEKAAQDAINNFFIPVNASPTEVVIANSQKSILAARLDGIRQSINQTNSRIEAIQAARARNIELKMQKIIIETKIHFEQRVVQDIIQIAPIIQRTTLDAHNLFGVYFSKLGNTIRNVINTAGRLTRTITDTRSSQRTLENTVLLINNDPVAIRKFINEKDTSTKILTLKNEQLKTQLTLLVSESQSKVAAIPSLLDTARTLTLSMNDAITIRTELEASLRNLNPPDYTDLVNHQRDILAQITILDTNIKDIAIKLEGLERDIINAVAIRDFLIAKKAEFEDIELKNLQNGIVQPETDYNTSKTEYENEEQNRDSINKILADIAFTIAPYINRHSTLIEDVERIRRNIQYVLTPTLQAKIIELGIVNDNKNDAITLLLETIKQNANDIATLTGVNNSINRLREINGEHDILAQKIRDALDSIGILRIEDTIRNSDSEGYNTLLTEILNHLRNNVEPALIITQSNESDSRNAYTNANTNLTTVTGRISSDRSEITRLTALQKIITDRILGRTAESNKILYQTNRANSHGFRVTAESKPPTANKPKTIIETIQNILSKITTSFGNRNIAETELTRLNELRDAAILSKTTNRILKDDAADRVTTITDESAGLPAAIAAEVAQRTSLEGQIEALGPKPDEPTVPVVNIPPKPDSSADEAALASLQIPLVDSNRVSDAEAAKDARIQDAEDAKNARVQNSEGALKTAENNVKTLTSDLTTIDGPALDAANKAVESARIENESNAKTLEADIQYLANLGLDSAREAVIEPDPEPTRLAEQDVKERTNEFPVVVERPSRTPEEIEAISRATQLASELNVVLAEINTVEINKSDTETGIRNKPGEIQTAQDNVSTSTALVEELRINLLTVEGARDSSSKTLQNAESSIDALTTTNNESTARIALDTQVVSVLNKLEQLDAQHADESANGTNGAVLFTIARNNANSNRRTAESKAPTAIKPDAIIDEAADIARYADEIMAEEANLLRLDQLRDIAIADKLLNNELKVDANDVVIAIRVESTGLETAIAAEVAQRTSLEGQIEALGPKPNEPTFPVINIPPKPDSSADKAELAALQIPPVDSNRVSDAEAAKKAKVDAVIAGFTQNSAVALKTAENNVKTLTSDLTTRDEPAVDAANKSVESARIANESTAKTLEADIQYLANLGLDSAREAVIQPDPEPTRRAEQDVKEKNEKVLEIRTVERPSRLPILPDLRGFLNNIMENVTRTTILKKTVEDDIEDINIFSIDTTLFDTASSDYSNATTKFANATTNLTNALTQLETSKNNGTNLEILVNNLHNALNNCGDIKTVRTDANNTIIILTTSRNAREALRIAERDLRNAISQLSTADKNSVTNYIKKIDDTRKALKEATDKLDAAGIDNDANANKLAELERARRDAHDAAYENKNLADTFTDHTDVDGNIFRETQEATRLQAEIDALGLKPDEPTVPVLNVPPKPDSSADEAALAALQIPPVDSNRVPDAEAAKDARIQDAEDAKDARLNDSQNALKDAASDVSRLTTELANESTKLDTVNKDVDNADEVNDTSIANRDSDEKTAIEMDINLQTLKNNVNEIKDSVDSIQRILDSITLDTLPPRQDPPDAPTRPPDESDNLARLNQTIESLNTLKNNTDILINKILNESPILTKKISDDVENLRYTLRIFEIATTKRLEEGAKLALENIKIKNLEDSNTVSKIRNERLKIISESLKKFSDKLNQRRIDISKMDGIARRHALDQDAARKARKLAKEAAKKANKDADTNRMNELLDKLQKLKNERDSNEEYDADLAAKITDLENLIDRLNENTKGIRDIEKQINRYINLKNYNEQEIINKKKEIDDLINKIKREIDSEKIKKLKEDLEKARKKLADLESIRKKVNDELNKLINEGKRLTKQKIALDELKKKASEVVKSKNKADLNIAIPLGFAAAFAGLVGATLLGASAFSGPKILFNKSNEPDDKNDCSDGTDAGNKDGERVGQEEGRKAGLAAKNAAEQASTKAAQESALQDAQSSTDLSEVNNGNVGPTGSTEPIGLTDSTGPTGTNVSNNIYMQNAGANVDANANNADANANNAGANTNSTGANANNSNNSTNNINQAKDDNLGAEAEEEIVEEEPIEEVPEVPVIPEEAPVAEEEVPEEAPEPPKPYPYPRNTFPTNTYKKCYINAFNKIYSPTWKAYWLEGRTGKPANISNLSSGSQNNNLYFIKSEKYDIDGYFNYVDSADGEYYEYINNDKPIFILLDDIKEVISSTYSPADESTPNERKTLKYRIDSDDKTNEIMKDSIIQEYTGRENDSKIKKATYLVFENPDEPIYKLIILYTDINEGLVEITLDGKTVNTNELIMPRTAEGEEAAVEDVEVEIPDGTAGGGNISDDEEVIPTF